MAVPRPTEIPRFAQLLSWAATTYYALEERVVNGSNVYVCTTAGTSAGSGGPTGTGSGIADGSVVWDYVGPSAAAWVGLHAYVAGDRVTNGGSLYQATADGTSAATGGPTGTGAGIVDGTVRWVYLAAATALVVEPSEGQKDVGWIAGQRPPAQYFNWLLYNLYLWARYLQDIANQAITWTVLQTYLLGIIVSTTAANGTAVTATGNGAGSGVAGAGGTTSGKGGAFTGGFPSGVGASGNGVGLGVGLLGTGGSGGAPGVSGVGTAPVAWQATHLYVKNAVITNDTLKVYIATSTSGTSAGSGGPTGTGSGIVDGGVTWDYIGAVGSQAGVTGTGATSSTGAGGDFTGGTGGGAGVKGTGGATSGPGGQFTGGGTNGPGVVAQGTGNGPGVKGTGGTVSPGILGAGTTTDYPIFVAEDSAGNNRFLVDHNGFPLGYLSRFYQGWCPRENLNTTTTSTKIPDFTLSLLGVGTGTASTENPASTYNSRFAELDVGSTVAADGAAWWDSAGQFIPNADTSIVIDFDVMIASRSGGAVVKVGVGSLVDGDPDNVAASGAWLSFSGAHADWRYNVKRASGVPAAVTDQATGVGPAVGTNLWLPVRIELHGANTPIGNAAGSAVTRFFVNQGLVGTAVAQVPDGSLMFTMAVVQSGASAGGGNVRVGPVRACWNRVLAPSML